MNKLLYLGHASIRIITREGKVIYIDPYMGDDYSMSADLILVTHSHYDHNDLDKVKNRNDSCIVITNKESLVNGEYKTFDLGYVKIEAVPAGYNKFHDEKECVGYLLTLGDKKIYILGDTYITPYMESIGKMNIDYAFIPCDGVYTMNIDEAIEASKLINAKYSIPYHTKPGDSFDINVANEFNVNNKLVIKPNEEIML